MDSIDNVGELNLFGNLGTRECGVCIIFHTYVTLNSRWRCRRSRFDYHLALIAEEEQATLGDVMPAKARVLVMKTFIIDL